MTKVQFEAARQRTRTSNWSASTWAAEDVLVAGKTISEAARAHKINPSTVSRAVHRIEEAAAQLELTL